MGATFIKKIEEPKDDEDRPINLDFDDIKAETLNTIRNIHRINIMLTILNKFFICTENICCTYSEY